MGVYILAHRQKVLGFDETSHHFVWKSLSCNNMPKEETKNGFSSNNKNGFSDTMRTNSDKRYGSYKNNTTGDQEKSVDHFKELKEYRMVNWKSIVRCRLNSK